MVSQDMAGNLLKEAHDFVNGDPEDRVQEFFLAKEVEVEPEEDDEDGEGEQETELEIGRISFHENINTELNAIFVEELYKLQSSVDHGNQDILPYQASNIEKDPKPVQYVSVDDIPDYDIYRPFTRESGFDETEFSKFEDADFQAIRIRDRLSQQWFVGFRKYTARQVIGSSWKVKLLLRGEEYDVFEEDVYALPETFDAFVFDDVLFVKNQSQAEDIFGYFDQYRESANRVFQGIQDSEFTIHNMDEFKAAVYRDKNALRKMVEVENRGIYDRLSQDQVEQVIDEYDLDVETAERNGDWGIVLPSAGDKGEIISLLNDDHLYSDITDSRYQARGKEERG